MKSKTLMLPFIVAVMFLLVGLVSATDVASIDKIEVNSAVAFPGSFTSNVEAGDTIPVLVVFTANVDASEVEVEIEINNIRDEDRKSTRLNSSHSQQSRMPSSA